MIEASVVSIIETISPMENERPDPAKIDMLNLLSNIVEGRSFNKEENGEGSISVGVMPGRKIRNIRDRIIAPIIEFS